MNILVDPSFFSNPMLVRVVAFAAVSLLAITWWLFRRRRRGGYGATVLCLLLSIGLHVALIWYVPRLSAFQGAGDGSKPKSDSDPGLDEVAVAFLEPSAETGETAPAEDSEAASLLRPLPLELPALTQPAPMLAAQEPRQEPSNAPEPTEEVPLAATAPLLKRTASASVMQDDVLGDWLDETIASATAVSARSPSSPAASTGAASSSDTPPVVAIDGDFASRRGAAKQDALHRTGGDGQSEASVAAALKYLAGTQRPDGAWDPTASGAGQERMPLGLRRGNAGRNAETGLTGLALLAFLGSGNTHQSGDYQDVVYRGLVYLLKVQRGDGSLAGGESVYAAHYCHAMAGMAIAEAAALTRDPAAMEATRRAVAYTKSVQHPSTGGWRYQRGDTGDLSQLGWQVMLLDAAVRGGVVTRDEKSSTGVSRFLASVRTGQAGGLASYRPGERASMTMTAEALAMRLLTLEAIPPAAIAEAEAELMRHLPGSDPTSPDNLYGWYYATLALHQLQDEAWQRWNESLRNRLMATQRPDGSWPDTTVWGGYGGTVYTTALSAMCLETYYRHATERSSQKPRSF